MLGRTAGMLEVKDDEPPLQSDIKFVNETYPRPSMSDEVADTILQSSIFLSGRDVSVGQLDDRVKNVLEAARYFWHKALSAGLARVGGSQELEHHDREIEGHRSNAKKLVKRTWKWTEEILKKFDEVSCPPPGPCCPTSHSPSPPTCSCIFFSASLSLVPVTLTSGKTNVFSLSSSGEYGDAASGRRCDLENTR